MTYQTTITKKGQIVIPVKIRTILGLKPNQKIFLEVKNKNEAVIKPAEDILDLAGTFKPKKVTSAVKIREKLETMYGRV